MVDYEMLARIGTVVNVVVGGGYTIFASYLVRIGIHYVSDYKESVANEEGVK